MGASNASIPYDLNVSNFISVKLSDKESYVLWKAQMLCLLNSINICGILDGTFVGPRDSGIETVKQYDNLVRGWIFGSISKNVLVEVFNLESAKAVWEKLQSKYDSTLSLPEASHPPPPVLRSATGRTLSSATPPQPLLRRCHSATAATPPPHPLLRRCYSSAIPSDITSETPNAKAEKEDRDVVPHTNSMVVTISTEIDEVTQISEQDKEHKKKLKILKSAIMEGDWPEVESILNKNKGLAGERISNDGSTALHIAVGIGYNDVVKSLLRYINYEQLLKQRDSDGSTALHVAAIVGNKEGAELLVEQSDALLLIKDKHDRIPSNKAYEHMHLDTMAYLLRSIHRSYDENALVELAVNAISTRKYRLALMFLLYNPKVASRSDEVLMAIAKNFPSGLDGGAKLIYPPSLKSIWEILWKTALVTVYLFACPAFIIQRIFVALHGSRCNEMALQILYASFSLLLVVILIGPLFMLASALAFILLLVLIVSLPFPLLYLLSWKGAKILAFPPIMKIENKIKDWNEAKGLLTWVCDEIDKLNYHDAYHPRYAGPIIEATRQNAYDVVGEILSRSPEAIQSKDKNGYNIILLAIINRSEKIYNHIYDVGEGKNLYRTYEDSSKNNILHLAGKLASSNVLNQRTGAALQLQRELQWREEVKKLVIPKFITKENIYKETPDMVFTREHMDLMKEGEQWMKTTAESCSITAALITTIVFAAAITVPGGSDQAKGTPLFKKEIAFIIFAISDAISLFASTTALLVFLSILTARFAEKDFLVSLPRRLFIGLFALLLSTTTMMVAFSATVFLVFCDKKLWTLAPICGLAFIPIATFVNLQSPLLVDLFYYAYLPIFGREWKNTPKDFIRRIHRYTHYFF